MKESAKCEEMRTRRGDFQKYLHGVGIDIGAGPDCLRVPDGSVRAWDIQDGDAQLLPGVNDASFDFVYSSHCLEHMRDVPTALGNWVRVLKPGGWLYFVVPDYLLYEKLTWPSRFNADHKQSFSNLITRELVARPNHWHMEQNLLPLLEQLGLGDRRWTLESNHFNFNAGTFDQTAQIALAQLCVIARKK